MSSSKRVLHGLRGMGFQSFSYDHSSRLFTSGHEQISFLDLNPDRIPKTEVQLPISYYDEALLLAHGAMECVQMPKMTKWLQGLTRAEARSVEDESLGIMQDVFREYRNAHGQSRLEEISDSFGLSVDQGLIEMGASTHMIFSYTYCGDLVNETDMDNGYVEFHDNNLNDLPGNSLKVAFLAGVGSLAFQAERALFQKM